MSALREPGHESTRPAGRWATARQSGFIPFPRQESKEALVVNPYVGTVRAPDFPPGLEWINTEPLSMGRLRGKLVLLDFWTYC